MLASLKFSAISKNKILFKQLQTNSTVESSIAEDTMIINSLYNCFVDALQTPQQYQSVCKQRRYVTKHIVLKGTKSNNTLIEPAFKIDYIH